MNRIFFKAIALCVVSVFWGCGGTDPATEEKNTKSDESKVASTGRPDRRKDGPSSRQSKRIDQNTAKQVGEVGTASSLDDARKMKSIGLALHSYMAKNKAFPFSTMAKGIPKRHPELSWRVELLGTLGQGDLRKKFNQEESPAEPSNASLALSVKGLFGLSNGALISGIKTEKPITHFREVVDGTSNTVMLIENPNANSGDWATENDVTVNEAVALLKSIKPGESLRVCFYDGHVLSIGCLKEKKLSDEQIALLFKPNDLMPIPGEIFSN